EDGIRDRNVPGVQTCALPISCFHDAEIRSLTPASDPAATWLRAARTRRTRTRKLYSLLALQFSPATLLTSGPTVRVVSDLRLARSEERRVGKELRSRWWTWQE